MDKWRPALQVAQHVFLHDAFRVSEHWPACQSPRRQRRDANNAFYMQQMARVTANATAQRIPSQRFAEMRSIPAVCTALAGGISWRLQQ